eukprot:scaffold609_cov170-Amphora_coffeaeformis.AAC.17
MVTGIRWVSAAIRAAAEPATPDPMTKSRSSGTSAAAVLWVLALHTVVCEKHRPTTPRRKRVPPLCTRDVAPRIIFLPYIRYCDNNGTTDPNRFFFLLPTMWRCLLQLQLRQTAAKQYFVVAVCVGKLCFGYFLDRGKSCHPGFRLAVCRVDDYGRFSFLIRDDEWL